MPDAGPEREDDTQIIRLLRDAAAVEVRNDETTQAQALHDTAVTKQHKLRKLMRPVKIIG